MKQILPFLVLWTKKRGYFRWNVINNCW